MSVRAMFAIVEALERINRTLQQISDTLSLSVKISFPEHTTKPQTQPPHKLSDSKDGTCSYCKQPAGSVSCQKAHP